MTNYIEISLSALDRLRRPRALTWSLGLALIVLVPLFGGCACPEPRHATQVVDSPEHVKNVETTIANAQARRVWTVEDERAFSRNLTHLSSDTAFAYAKQIAVLINNGAMTIDRRPPKTKRPALCPCGTCKGTTTPAAPASPDTSGGRPGMQPSAQPGTAAPASPAAKQPTRVP